MKLHQPCPCGKSSDAFTLYEDGHGYCYSGECEQPHWSKGRLTKGETMKLGEVVKLPVGKTVALTDRGITKDTCKKFGVTVLAKKGKIIKHAYPFANKEGDKVAVKMRSVEKKDFRCVGDMQSSVLFGQNLFEGGGKYLTITEGELDAMAVFQMQGSQYPSVSLKNGSAAAAKECKENYEYINSFDNVIICFDNDAAGKLAAKKVANIFPGKAKVVQLSKFNDPCDYLKVHADKEFNKEWWQAKTHSVEGFSTGTEVVDIIKQTVSKGVPLAWQKLSDNTYGVRLHELWFFAGGTGLGKSELFKEMAYELAVNQNKKIGMIMLEESDVLTWKCLLGKDMNKRLYLEENRDLVKEFTLESSPNAEKIMRNTVVVQHKGNADFDDILRKMEYMAVGLDCEYIFFDHFTASAEGKEDSSNNKVHNMMEKLNQFVHSKNVTVFAISHLRKMTKGTPAEEGGHVALDDIYGSAAIKQRSNFVFALEGNLNAEGVEKNVRVLRCLKDRNTGQATGMDNAVVLQYDGDTGRLEQMEMEE